MNTKTYHYPLSMEAAHKLRWLRDAQYLLVEARRREQGKGTRFNPTWLRLVSWLYATTAPRIEREAARLGILDRLPPKKWEAAARTKTTAPPKTNVDQRS